MKNLEKSFFIPPHEDFEKAYHLAIGLGYKFIMEVIPNIGQEPCAWAILDKEELIEVCKLVNETNSYKIYESGSIIDLENFSSN